ncbi:MAG: hypothetical protein EOM08_13605 [Clostridia bacterium]|nr:hypothetical protein [Clostridia bacterium]
MPKKTITAPLRGFVRSEIAKAFEESGFARPREIARQVFLTHPNDVERAGQRLAEDALTDMARSELKNSTRQHGVDTQLRLPIVPPSLAEQLPAAISIPSDDDVAEDKVVYKPLSKATLEEIEAHLKLLATQILADRKRHHALKELRDLAVAAGARSQSVVVDILGHLAIPQIDLLQLPASLPHIPTHVITQEVRS